MLIPLSFQILSVFNYNSLRLKKTSIKFNRAILPLFFILFLLVLSLRNKYLGRDLVNYEHLFIKFGNSSLGSVFSSWSEIVYRFYCWFFYNHISNNYQLFVSITAILSVIPIMYVYCKDKTHGYLKIAIFVNMSTYVMLFSGIRQGLAMALGLLAYQTLKDKKYILFILLSILATFTHHTGFMVFLLFPLFFFRFKTKDLWWIISSIMTVFIFNKPIFNFLSSLAGSFNDKYGVQATETGAFMSFVLFALFATFCFLVEDEKTMDNDAYALRNILVFAVVLQSFAFVNDLAMRMNYYFILLIPLAVGNAVKNASKVNYQMAKIGELVLSVFFTIYFVYAVYSSFKNGSGFLDTIPYVPFWKEI